MAAGFRIASLERAFSGRLVADDGASHPGVDDGIKEDDIARIKGGQSSA